MSLTGINFLDIKILLRLSYLQILAFASSNKYFYSLICNPQFMLQIISRDFNVELSLNIPHSMNLINYYYYLNEMLFYDNNIKIIQFLIATNQKQLLLLFIKKYGQNKGNIVKQLVELQDFTSLKYLQDKNIKIDIYIDFMIEKFPLNELLSNLSLFKLKMEFREVNYIWLLKVRD